MGLVGVVALEEQVPAGGALGDQLAHLGGGLLAHRRRPGLLQQDCAVGLPGQATVSHRIGPKSMSLVTSKPSLPT